MPCPGPGPHWDALFMHNMHNMHAACIGHPCHKMVLMSSASPLFQFDAACFATFPQNAEKGAGTVMHLCIRAHPRDFSHEKQPVLWPFFMGMMPDPSPKPRLLPFFPSRHALARPFDARSFAISDEKFFLFFRKPSIYAALREMMPFSSPFLKARFSL